MKIYHLSKDTLIIGALAGTIAKVVQDVLGLIIIMVLPTYMNCVRIAGGLILTYDQVMNGGIWPMILGFQIDLMVGIVVAIVLILILQQWGNNYYLFKGVMTGLVAWALFYIVLSTLLSRVHPFGSILHAELAFFTHIAFGISLTWSTVWLSKRFTDQDDCN